MQSLTIVFIYSLWVIALYNVDSLSVCRETSNIFFLDAISFGTKIPPLTRFIEGIAFNALSERSAVSVITHSAISHPFYPILLPLNETKNHKTRDKITIINKYLQSDRPYPMQHQHASILAAMILAEEAFKELQTPSHQRNVFILDDGAQTAAEICNDLPEHDMNVYLVKIDDVFNLEYVYDCNDRIEILDEYSIDVIDDIYDITCPTALDFSENINAKINKRTNYIEPYAILSCDINYDIDDRLLLNSSIIVDNDIHNEMSYEIGYIYISPPDVFELFPDECIYPSFEITNITQIDLDYDVDIDNDGESDTFLKLNFKSIDIFEHLYGLSSVVSPKHHSETTKPRIIKGHDRIYSMRRQLMQLNNKRRLLEACGGHGNMVIDPAHFNLTDIAAQESDAFCTFPDPLVPVEEYFPCDPSDFHCQRHPTRNWNYPYSPIHYIPENNLVAKYGLKTKSGADAGGDLTLSITLLFNQLLYQCNILPSSTDTEYSCEASSSYVGASECNRGHHFFISGTKYVHGHRVDEPELDYIFVEFTNGTIAIFDVDNDSFVLTPQNASFVSDYDCAVDKTLRLSQFLCNEVTECKNGVFQCNDNADCHILCSSDNACFNAQFKCPAYGNCNVELLNGVSVGKYITIDASNTVSGDLTIELYINISTAAMSGANIYCPAFGDCTITVEQTSSFVSRTLSNALIVAYSTTKSLSITGTGYCAICDAEIYCPPSDCDISLSGSYRSQLEGTSIYTYDGSSGLSINAQITTAQTIDDYPCAFSILSNDHEWWPGQKIGMYFNFDRDGVDCMLGYSYSSGSVDNVFYSGSNAIRTVKMWRTAHTADQHSTGQGRKNSNANTGDWSVGELVAFDGEYDIPCNAKKESGCGGNLSPHRCWFEILSNDHNWWRGSRIGRYFNFDRETVDCILGHQYQSGSVWDVLYSGTMTVRKVKLWRGAHTDNPPANGQGRQDPSSDARDGDWEPGEFIAFVGLDSAPVCYHMGRTDCSAHVTAATRFCRNDHPTFCDIKRNADATYSCATDVSCPVITNDRESKSVSLSPSNTVDNGAVVLLDTSTINNAVFVNSNNEWQMQTKDSSSTYGWQMEISLDDSWVFNPDVNSVFTLKIYGTSLVSASVSDLIMAFSADATTYFTVGFPMDNNSTNTIRPHCDTATMPTQPLSSGDIKQSAGCKSGYYQQIGDVPGWGKVNGRGGGEVVPSCDSCAALCDEDEQCRSIECSPSQHKCNLNAAPDPTPGAPQYGDYLFCTKVINDNIWAEYSGDVEGKCSIGTNTGYIGDGTSSPVRCILIATAPGNNDDIAATTTNGRCRGGGPGPVSTKPHFIHGHILPGTSYSSCRGMLKLFYRLMRNYIWAEYSGEETKMCFIGSNTGYIGNGVNPYKCIQIKDAYGNHGGWDIDSINPRRLNEDHLQIAPPSAMVQKKNFNQSAKAYHKRMKDSGNLDDNNDERNNPTVKDAGDWWHLTPTPLGGSEHIVYGDELATTEVYKKDFIAKGAKVTGSGNVNLTFVYSADIKLKRIFEPEFGLAWNCFGCVTYLKVGFIANITFELDVHFHASGKLGLKYPFLDKKFGPYTFWIGEVPVIYQPFITVLFKASMMVDLRYDPKFTYNRLYTAEMIYSQNKFTPGLTNQPSSNTPSFEITDHEELSTKLSIGLGVEVGILLYDVLKLYLSIGIPFNIDAILPDIDCHFPFPEHHKCGPLAFGFDVTLDLKFQFHASVSDDTAGGFFGINWKHDIGDAFKTPALPIGAFCFPYDNTMCSELLEVCYYNAASEEPSMYPDVWGFGDKDVAVWKKSLPEQSCTCFVSNAWVGTGVELNFWRFQSCSRVPTRIDSIRYWRSNTYYTLKDFENDCVADDDSKLWVGYEWNAQDCCDLSVLVNGKVHRQYPREDLCDWKSATQNDPQFITFFSYYLAFLVVINIVCCIYYVCDKNEINKKRFI